MTYLLRKPLYKMKSLSRNVKMMRYNNFKNVKIRALGGFKTKVQLQNLIIRVNLITNNDLAIIIYHPKISVLVILIKISHKSEITVRSKKLLLFPTERSLDAIFYKINNSMNNCIIIIILIERMIMMIWNRLLPKQI